MSSEKRLLLTMLLTIASVYGIQMLMERAGLIKPPPKVKPPEAVAQEDPARAKPVEVAKGELPDNPFAPEISDDPVKLPAVKPINPGELVLGSDEDDAPEAYHLRLQLDQKGAVVASATLAHFDAEIDPAKPPIPGRKPRLELIAEISPDSPGSLALTLVSTSRAAHQANVDAEGVMEKELKIEAPLDTLDWDVVREKDGVPGPSGPSPRSTRLQIKKSSAKRSPSGPRPRTRSLSSRRSIGSGKGRTGSRSS